MPRAKDYSKYKLFRNFMVNELGIGREEIETWVRDSVREEVNKMIGYLPPFRAQVEQIAKDEFRALRREIAHHIADNFTRRIKITEDESESEGD